jgi:YD repeat-containing protein
MEDFYRRILAGEPRAEATAAGAVGDEEEVSRSVLLAAHSFVRAIRGRCHSCFSKRGSVLSDNEESGSDWQQVYFDSGRVLGDLVDGVSIEGQKLSRAMLRQLFGQRDVNGVG